MWICGIGIRFGKGSGVRLRECDPRGVFRNPFVDRVFGDEGISFGGASRAQEETTRRGVTAWPQISMVRMEPPEAAPRSYVA